jgi:DNA-binding Lrp family transcriptional regulator
MNPQECILEIERELGWIASAPVGKESKPEGVAQKKTILDLLKEAPALSTEIAEKMGVRPKTINHYTRQLERLGCIKFEPAGWNFKQLHFVTYDNYDKEPPAYEKRKRAIKQEKLPELPFDPFLSRMMGYTDIPVPQAEVICNLDRPFKSEPLRKLNLAWHGYSCEISV